MESTDQGSNCTSAYGREAPTDQRLISPDQDRVFRGGVGEL
jgi:hypothetical protein